MGPPASLGAVAKTEAISSGGISITIVRCLYRHDCVSSIPDIRAELGSGITTCVDGMAVPL
jgi:hypothetical protein